MREIKFRAWDKDAKKMYSPIEMYESNFVIAFNGLVFANGDTGKLWLQRMFTLMQYTGLKDKNGKEIYRSDYVKTPAGVGLIVWDKCYWIKWSGGGRTTLHDTSAEQMEVIGNEYENKKG